MTFPFLSRTGHLIFLHNSFENWAAALLVTLGSLIAMYVVRSLVLRRMAVLEAATGNRIDGLVIKMLSNTYLLCILAFALYFGSTFLDMTRRQDVFVTRIALAALLLQVAIWGDTGLRAWRDQYRSGPAADDERRASSSVVCFILRLVLWLIVTLMFLDNFGINITTLVASLGIGGVAVALATQNILGDLFASLSIMLDKPFEVGDFIIVGDVLGWVEHIGLKTTRVRGLGGEQVVFANGELLKSRIHNHKRLQRRRVAFVLRVAYGTSEALLARIPGLVRDIVAAQPGVDFERCHFFMWGDWSLNFEVVYHYTTPDFFAHMDAQQAIFLEIYRRFEREGIPFAQPVSVVRLADPGLAGFTAPNGPAPAPPGPSVH